MFNRKERVMGDERKDPVLELVMGVEARKEACSKGIQDLMKRYNCSPQVVEVRVGGITASIQINWVPNEAIQGSGSRIIQAG